MESPPIDFLFKIMEGLGTYRPARMDYTPKSTSCILEYQGKFYKLTIENIEEKEKTA